MINEEKSKQNFVEMCKFVTYVEDTGEIYCAWDEMKESTLSKVDFTDPNYRELRRKLKKLVKLVRKDNSLINRDIETDLWNIL